ncbi:MAG TPA: hypothetical protein VMV10_32355 [Pirellulales bacterium]|nr:hypothetical protein [Pirellulales bacterium]
MRESSPGHLGRHSGQAGAVQETIVAAPAEVTKKSSLEVKKPAMAVAHYSPASASAAW